MRPVRFAYVALPICAVASEASAGALSYAPCTEGNGNVAYREDRFHISEISEAMQMVRANACPVTWALPAGETRVDRRYFSYYVDRPGLKKCMTTARPASAANVAENSFQVVLARSSNAELWETWANRMHVRRSFRAAVKTAFTTRDATELKAYAKDNLGSVAVDLAHERFGGLLMSGVAPLAAISVAGIPLELTYGVVVTMGLAALKLGYAQTCQGKFEAKRSDLLTKYFRQSEGAIVYSFTIGGGFVNEEVDALLTTASGTISIPIAGARSKFVVQ